MNPDNMTIEDWMDAYYQQGRQHQDDLKAIYLKSARESNYADEFDVVYVSHEDGEEHLWSDDVEYLNTEYEKAENVVMDLKFRGYTDVDIIHRKVSPWQVVRPASIEKED